MPARGSGEPGPAAPCYKSKVPESYRHSSGEEQTREITFESLSPSTQQRLIESFEGRGALLLLDEPAPTLGTPRRWAALGAAGLGPLLAILGAPGGAPVWVRAPWLAAVAAGLALSLTALFMGQRRRRAGAIRPGVFLFASDLVDARSLPLLRVIPTSTIEGVFPIDTGFSLRLRGDRSYSFSSRRAAARGDLFASDLSRELEVLRGRLERAESSGDMAEQRALDPFIEERARWARERPEARGALRLSGAGLSPAAAVAASLALGAALAWPAARAAAALHDAGGIAVARQAQDDDALLRFTFGPRPGFVVVGGQQQRAVNALHELLPSRKDLDLHFALLQIDDPRRASVDEEIFRRALAAPDRAALRRYARLPTRHAARVLREHLPRLDLEDARRNTNLRGLWRLAEDEAIDARVRADARAAIGELYDRERAALRGKTSLATPLSQVADDLLVFLSKSSHAADAAAEGHFAGPTAPELEVYRNKINTLARKAMVHAFYTHIDPDIFRVRAQADAEAKPDEQSPRLQLLYKMRSTAEDPASPVSIELTVALMHPEREGPLRVDLRFVVPSPLDNDAFYDKLCDALAGALKGGLRPAAPATGRPGSRGPAAPARPGRGRGRSPRDPRAPRAPRRSPGRAAARARPSAAAAPGRRRRSRSASAPRSARASPPPPPGRSNPTHP